MRRKLSLLLLAALLLGGCEQAADEAGLRYTSAPAAPPAGHYRVAWLCNLSGLADAGDWAAAHPGMVSTVSGKEGPWCLLTVEFDIVA